MSEQRLMKPEEVAERLALSPKTIYKMASLGQLPCLRFGRSVRVEVEALNRFLAERRRPS
jgi:excisionase family DNA binding protein